MPTLAEILDPFGNTAFGIPGLPGAFSRQNVFNPGGTNWLGSGQGLFGEPASQDTSRGNIRTIGEGPRRTPPRFLETSPTDDILAGYPSTDEPLVEAYRLERLLERGFEEKQAGRGIGVFEEAERGIGSNVRKQQRAVASIREFLRNALDPLRSQYQGLVDTPAISPEIREGLLSNIRAQSANTLARQQQDITSRAAARGLAGGSVASRDLSQNIQATTTGRLGLENELQATIADINRRGEEAGLAGLAGLQDLGTRAELGLLSGQLGALGQSSQLGLQSAFGKAGAIAGQEFIPQDFLGELGFKTEQEFLDSAREAMEKEGGLDNWIRDFILAWVPYAGNKLF